MLHSLNAAVYPAWCSRHIQMCNYIVKYILCYTSTIYKTQTKPLTYSAPFPPCAVKSRKERSQQPCSMVITPHTISTTVRFPVINSREPNHAIKPGCKGGPLWESHAEGERIGFTHLLHSSMRVKCLAASQGCVEKAEP